MVILATVQSNDKRDEAIAPYCRPKPCPSLLWFQKEAKPRFVCKVAKFLMTLPFYSYPVGSTLEKSQRDK